MTGFCGIKEMAKPKMESMCGKSFPRKRVFAEYCKVNKGLPDDLESQFSKAEIRYLFTRKAKSQDIVCKVLSGNIMEHFKEEGSCSGLW